MNNSDENHNKKRGYPSYVIVSIISAILGGIIFLISFSPILNKNLTNNKNLSTGITDITIKPSDDITTPQAVYKKAMESVVGITTTEIIQDIWAAKEVEGVGSGIIVSEDGYILTNSHVILNGKVEKIRVLFADGKEKEAKIVWQDSTMDLAIIKTESSGLKAAELGDSDDIEIGEPAIAIGNPLGLEFERTLTSGVISGIDRSIDINEVEKMEGLIQTDASINAGNSGGPLLNSEGNVIGINTLKVSSANEGIEGMGFSLPINIAKPAIEEVLKTGEIKEIYLGIQGIDAARYQKMTGEDLGIEHGVLIEKVAEGSPAEKSNLQKKDIIYKINNIEVSSFRELKKQLYNYKPGDEITVSIYRNNMSEEVRIVLEEAS